MAGDYARIKRAIWIDEDFLDRSPVAQWLYFHLLTSDLSLAGVSDWRPKKIVPKSTGLTVDVVTSAAEEMQDALYLIIDDDTEEVLIRSFVRHDGLLKQPNMGVAVAKAYGSIASRELRAVMVYELQRLHHEEPKLSGWDALSEILKKPSLDPAVYVVGKASENLRETG